MIQVESMTRHNTYTLERFAEDEPSKYRRVKWVVRLGDSADRGRLIQQETGDPVSLQPEVPLKPSEVVDAQIPPSPVAHIPDDQWAELLAQPVTKMLIDELIESEAIVVRELPDPPRTPRRRGKPAET